MDGQPEKTLLTEDCLFGRTTEKRKTNEQPKEDITERKRAEEALKRLAEEREIVAKIGRIISSTLEIERVYELFAEEVRKVIPFDRIAINIVYPEKGTFVTAYVLGTDIEGRRTRNVIPLAGSFTEEVVRTRSTQVIQTNNIDEVTERFPALLPSFQAGLRSILSVPLISRNQVIGALNFGSLKPEAYTDADLKLAESIGAQIAGAIANAQLYAEHKRAEQQIRRLNRELEDRIIELKAVNEELEAFSYSVSHDLRAPLRAIDGFSRIMFEDYWDNIDDEGKRLLKVIRNETRRMELLIDDLLTLSRLSRGKIKQSRIDMKALAKSVFKELKALDPEREVQLRIKTLPSAQGDRGMIRQVFANLLSNAVKFTRSRDKAVIEIGHRAKPMRIVYYVKDNGAGFDMQYVGKLFGVFQRLHSREEFEGTGVGLAIVKRIIGRHGGHVWAEGKVNEGATFYFSLPTEGAKK